MAVAANCPRSNGFFLLFIEINLAGSATISLLLPQPVRFWWVNILLYIGRIILEFTLRSFAFYFSNVRKWFCTYYQIQTYCHESEIHTSLTLYTFTCRNLTRKLWVSQICDISEIKLRRMCSLRHFAGRSWVESVIFFGYNRCIYCKWLMPRRCRHHNIRLIWQ